MEGSIFDSSYTSRLERAKFLQRVSERITAPVMPDDEPLEYLVTQTIADYLATRTEPTLDGILYPSAQGLDGGVNVMLFHKAALVAPIDIPEGTEISAHTGHNTEDGWEEEYWVFEEVPPTEPDKAQKAKGSGPDLAALLSTPKFYGDDDSREPTLGLDIKTLTVHRVTAVKFETHPFSVHRHRSEKRKHKFESELPAISPDEL